VETSLAKLLDFNAFSSRACDHNMGASSLNSDPWDQRLKMRFSQIGNQALLLVTDL